MSICGGWLKNILLDSFEHHVVPVGVKNEKVFLFCTEITVEQTLMNILTEVRISGFTNAHPARDQRFSKPKM